MFWENLLRKIRVSVMYWIKALYLDRGYKSFTMTYFSLFVTAFFNSDVNYLQVYSTKPNLIAYISIK